MELIGGKAGGLPLTSPADTGEVRPTSVRARRALFDSLGDLTGMTFADLFAGSGAMGLEAASRGAAQVIFVERSPEVLRIIAKNCARATSSGVDSAFRTVAGELPEAAVKLCALPRPEVIFADPPYARSADLLAALTARADFAGWAADAVMYWELPDAGPSVRPPAPPWKISAIKLLGSARFLVLKPEDGEKNGKKTEKTK